MFKIINKNGVYVYNYKRNGKKAIMSLENTLTEFNNIIGHALYEVCHWKPSGEVSIEGAWYITQVIGKDENGYIVVLDDEYAKRTIGVTSFLTPEEAYESATEEEKEKIKEWRLKWES